MFNNHYLINGNNNNFGIKFISDIISNKKYQNVYFNVVDDLFSLCLGNITSGIKCMNILILSNKLDRTILYKHKIFEKIVYYGRHFNTGIIILNLDICKPLYGYVGACMDYKFDTLTNMIEYDSCKDQY